MKPCPYCAEEIQDEAVKCKHCGEWLQKDTRFASQLEGLSDWGKRIVGLMKCPACGKWSVKRTYTEGGDIREWCPNCEKYRNTGKRLGTVWLTFWIWWRLPVGSLIAVLICVSKLADRTATAASIFGLLVATLAIAVAVGLYKRKLWAWKANWAIIVWDALWMAVSNSEVRSSYAQNPGVGIVVFFAIFALAAIVWILPNYLYFRKRKVLFSAGVSSSLPQSIEAASRSVGEVEDRGGQEGHRDINSVVLEALLEKVPRTHGKGSTRTNQIDSKKCPKCALINPLSALRCDCGYDFAMETVGPQNAGADRQEGPGTPYSVFMTRDNAGLLWKIGIGLFIGIIAGAFLIQALNTDHAGQLRQQHLNAPASAPATPADLSDGMAAYKRHDYAKAYKVFKTLAEQGNAQAQLELGSMYGTWGILPQNAPPGWRPSSSQDYPQAVYWYRRAAEQGNMAAQCRLGESYDTGDGVLQDYSEALFWYRKAAEQGSHLAQEDLGWMYRYGKGVPQDLVQAYMWFNLAGEFGHKGRDEVATLMTPSQIAEAQRLAKEWKPKGQY